MNTRITPVFRRLLAGFAGAVLAVALPAQESLTAATLAAWTSTGAAPVVNPRSGAVLLPVDGEISRTLDADNISLHLRSQPFFNAASEGWPTVEIGPAGLIFMRDKNGGGLVLAGNQLLLLPFTVALGADGRSQQPMDFTFSFNRTTSTGTLLLGGSTYNVPADSAGSGPVRIAISAGSSAPWTLDSLDLTASPVTDQSSAGSKKGGARSAGTNVVKPPEAALPASNRATTRKQVRDQSKNLFASGNDDAAEKALTDRNLNPKGSPEWHLESANELVQMAFSLSRAGKSDQAVRAARRALLHTGLAIQKTTQPGLAAVAEQTAGFIQERFLANLPEAKARYQAAVQRLPSGGARRSLDRLAKTDEEAARKQAAPGR